MISNKFTICNNLECKSIYVLSDYSKSEKYHFLCPNCISKTLTHHIIQCRTCGSILGMRETENDEQSNVFYVNNCSLCRENAEQDLKIQPFMYPNLLM